MLRSKTRISYLRTQSTFLLNLRTKGQTANAVQPYAKTPMMIPRDHHTDRTHVCLVVFYDQFMITSPAHACGKVIVPVSLNDVKVFI